MRKKTSSSLPDWPPKNGALAFFVSAVWEFWKHLRLLYGKAFICILTNRKNHPSPSETRESENSFSNLIPNDSKLSFTKKKPIIVSLGNPREMKTEPQCKKSGKTVGVFTLLWDLTFTEFLEFDTPIRRETLGNSDKVFVDLCNRILRVLIWFLLSNYQNFC